MTGLPAALVRLVRALRADGLAATPAEAALAVRAVAAVDAADREDVRLALRPLFTSAPEELARFDACFDRWSAGALAADAPPAPPPRATPPLEVTWIAPRRDRATVQVGAAHDGGDDGTPVPVRAPSLVEAASRRDLATLEDEERRLLRRAVARMARRLRARPGRRWKPSTRGERPDARGTARLALRHGGEALRLARRTRRLRRSRLVALCDVSGSMEPYSRFLLELLHALQGAFARVESFVFATRLVRVTPQLRRGTVDDVVARLGREATGWGGGTRIGDAVATFAREHGRLLDRRTVVLVLSDGWDTGDPETLGRALAAIRPRVARLVWLNPLLGTPGYEPATRGMRAALPHLDDFLPARDAASLERLARALVRRRRGARPRTVSEARAASPDRTLGMTEPHPEDRCPIP